MMRIKSKVGLRVLAGGLLWLLALGALAAQTKIGELYYDLNETDKTACVTGCIKYAWTDIGDVVIPESVTYSGTTYAVTTIGSEAFYKRTDLTSVTIPNSVTSIGNWAFSGCTGVTSIEIPNSVTKIGNSAFEGCTSLTSIEIYNSVTKIGTSAFRGCTGLTSIEIPNSVTSIGSSAFSGCTGLTSVTIGNSVTSIGNWAFLGCTGLTSVEIPNSVTFLSGFLGCTGLTSIEIPNSVTEIGYSAFDGCTGLTSVTIPNSVTEIGTTAFEGCTGLTSIEIPNSVTEIGNSAFAGCTGLTSIEIPNSVTEIGNSAFAGCTGLTSIEIPNSVTYIGDGTFIGCTGLTSIEIPNSVTEIGISAFSGCTGLTSIEIPNSVTKIGAFAFSGCTGLTEVTIADRGTALYFDKGMSNGMSNGYYCDAFKSCPIQSLYMGGNVDYYSDSYSYLGYYSPFKNLRTLETLTIGDSVTYIGDGTFVGCTGLRSVTIPNSVTTIGSVAFNGCIGLTDVTIADRDTVLTFRSGVFQSCHIRRLYLGGDMSYSGSNSPFSGLTTLETLTIGDSVTEIGNSACYGCTGLTSITLPNALDTVSGSAFAVCTGLTDVTIADRGTALNFGYSVFESCPISTLYLGGNVDYSSSPFRYLTTLETLTIGDSVTEIGDSAFYGCTGLMSITLPNALDTVSGSAFAVCTGLTDVTIADRGTALSFGYSVFESCPIRWLYLGGDMSYKTSPFRDLTTLETVTIGDSVTEIGSSAFSGCTGLSKFKTGDAVKKISDSAFSGCDNLLFITFGKSVSEIGAGIVKNCDKLRTLICISEDPAACHTDAFQDSHKLRCELVVPEAALKTYQTAPVWGDFFRIAEGDGSDRIYVERLSVTSPVTPVKLQVGDGIPLTAIVTPDSATNQEVAWSSSDIQVARVNQSGYVEAVGVGETVITVRTTDGTGLEATCMVTVDPVLVETLEISTGGASTELHPGGTLQLSAVITPDNATNQEVAWSSSDEGVAKVDQSGYVEAVGVGEAVITVRTTDGTGLETTCMVTVNPVLVETLEISTGGASPELYPGGTLQLSAVVTPADATNQTVTWSSSDTKVARVNQSGYVEAVGVGEAVITARTTDGSGLEATCTLTVKPVLAESIRISTNGKSTTLKVNATLQLSAIITPDNATSTAVTWSSSDAGVATVSTTGRVRAVAIGEAVVTARTTDGSDLSATCNIKVVAGNTAVEVPDALQAVRVYAEAGRIEVRGLPLGTAVTLSGVDGRLWYQTEAVTGSELSLVAPCGHVYVLRLNHMHSFKVYLP